LAPTELDDEVLDCSCVRQRVVEVEQAIFGSIGNSNALFKPDRPW
jgi:hypothetical protein